MSTIHLFLLFILPVAIVIIPGVFSISPGDPFPIDFDNQSDPFIFSNTEDMSNETILISVHSSSTKSESIPRKKLSLITINRTLVDQNENDNLFFSSTLKPIQDTLPIYKKHLVDIAQWKYTDPRTREIRYWYHTAGSIMGSGWILDRILCQAYIRQKPDTVPIRAFHSESKDIWTNTLQIESTPLPIGNNQWKYDGTPFYAYETSMNSSLLKPIWRYWNRINYGTEDVSEPRRSYLRMGDIVEDDLPGWRLDRILFYAFAPPLNVTEFNN